MHALEYLDMIVAPTIAEFEKEPTCRNQTRGNGPLGSVNATCARLRFGRPAADGDNRMKIVPFLFDNAVLVRSIERDGEPWFLAKDVCEALGIANNRDAVERLDDDEKNTVALTDGIPTRGNPNVLIISESGLYTLVLRCRDATTPGSTAHRFRKWVTAEVLPSIRKTGGYGESRLGEEQIARIAGEAAVAAVRALVPQLISMRPRGATSLRDALFATPMALARGPPRSPDDCSWPLARRRCSRTNSGDTRRRGHF